MRVENEKISNLIKQALEVTNYSETKLGEKLGLSRGMIAQYKAGEWDGKAGSRQRTHIASLKKIIAEFSSVGSEMIKGNIEKLFEEQAKRISRLETDMELLKATLTNLQRR